MAQRFKDSEGRLWSLRLNARILRDVKERWGVDLGSLLRDGQGVNRLVTADPQAISGVLWLLLGEEAERRGVSATMFAEALDGEALCRGVAALLLAACELAPWTLGAKPFRERLRSMLTLVDDEVAREVLELAELIQTDGL